MNDNNVIKDKLIFILSELEQQKDIAKFYSDSSLSYFDEMTQIREYLELAGEYSLAYETIVATLEFHPFYLSSKAAVKLLEVGLIMRFKTESEEDRMYDLRNIKFFK